MSFQIYYDDERGELVDEVDGAVREIIHVRAGLIEDHTLQAVITELERRGYVILGPYRSEPEQKEPAQ